MRTIALTTLSVLSALTLAGCSDAFHPTPVDIPGQARIGSISGTTYGGQQPIVGAKVYLYAAGTGGYGGNGITASSANASVSLLDSPGYVTTDVNGFFSITTDYTCTVGQQIYMLSLGGQPTTGTTNTAAGLMAVLGQCPASGSLAQQTPSVYMNEVTTVAAAYALAGFATDATHISSGAQIVTTSPLVFTLAGTGIANAFANAAQMANIASPSGSSGPSTNDGGALATTPNGNGTVPQQDINTLANILATCVNSNGATTPCTTLFADVRSGGGTTGTAATDTATAAIYLAHHPWSTYISTLFNLVGNTGAPFTPALSAAPNDFTVQLTFTGGGLDQGSRPAIDASGNIWVPSPGNNTLNEFSPLGVPLSGNSGFTGGGLSDPLAVAVDASGYVWVANFTNGTLSKFNSAGASVAGSGYLGNNDMQPYTLAIDTNGYVWVDNYTFATVSKVSSTGTEVLNTTDKGELEQTDGIAIDASNNVWIADGNDYEIDVLNNTTGLDNIQARKAGNGEITCTYSCRFIELSSGSSPLGWVSDITTEISSSTIVMTSEKSYSGGGLATSTSNILDGAGNIWVTNFNGTISEFNSAGTAITPVTGYTTSLTQTYGIAADGSGDIWVTDNGTTTGTQLVEFIGAATPTVTPLVQAVINNNIAGKP